MKIFTVCPDFLRPLSDQLESGQYVLRSEVIALESALREAYQISHYGRGSMQDVDDVLERAIRLCGSQSAMHSGGSADPERQGIDIPVIGSSNAKHDEP